MRNAGRLARSPGSDRCPGAGNFRSEGLIAIKRKEVWLSACLSIRRMTSLMRDSSTKPEKLPET